MILTDIGASGGFFLAPQHGAPSVDLGAMTLLWRVAGGA